MDTPAGTSRSWEQTNEELAELSARVIELQNLDVKHPGLDALRKRFIAIHYERIAMNQRDKKEGALKTMSSPLR